MSMRVGTGSLPTFVGKITMAQLNFSSISLRPKQSGLLPRLVDAIYQQATACHGSVHSMVGDTLLLSWNATHRVAHGEAKAARFLFHVHAAMKDYGVSAAGAACTGPAACEQVTASTGQLAFLIHCRWKDALQTLALLAARAHSVLLDDQTNSVASYDFETRAVDQLSYIAPTQHGIDIPPELLVNGSLLHSAPHPGKGTLGPTPLHRTSSSTSAADFSTNEKETLEKHSPPHRLQFYRRLRQLTVSNSSFMNW